MITGKFPALRLRRSRKNDWSRRLIEENSKFFISEGKSKKEAEQNAAFLCLKSLN